MATKKKRYKSKPARDRYWSSGRHAFRKIRNLVRSGYSVTDAARVWEKSCRRKKPDIAYGMLKGLEKWTAGRQKQRA